MRWNGWRFCTARACTGFFTSLNECNQDPTASLPPKSHRPPPVTLQTSVPAWERARRRQRPSYPHRYRSQALVSVRQERTNAIIIWHSVQQCNSFIFSSPVLPSSLRAFSHSPPLYARSVPFASVFSATFSVLQRGVGCKVQSRLVVMLVGQVVGRESKKI